MQFIPRRLHEQLAVDGANDADQRVRNTAEAFRAHYGRQPKVVVCAPGRVSIIGEHIDYEGYSVLCMALACGICIAFDTVVPNDPPATIHHRVKLVNTSVAFQERELALPLTESSISSSPDSSLRWSDYFVCGALGMLDHFQQQGNCPVGTEALALDLLVDGTVPVGCGLSSSSAMVVASSLVAAMAIDPQNLPSRLEIAQICRQAEHLVGTMGGGMDQAVCCLGQKGSAQFVAFSPLHVTPTKIPTQTLGVTFVIANSLVVAEKAVSAATHFNKRVIECALATKLLAKRLGMGQWSEVGKCMRFFLLRSTGIRWLRLHLIHSCSHCESYMSFLTTRITSRRFRSSNCLHLLLNILVKMNSHRNSSRQSSRRTIY